MSSFDSVTIHLDDDKIVRLLVARAKIDSQQGLTLVLIGQAEQQNKK